MSPEAVLYYGFHLGCPDDGGWEVAEADEYGNLSDAGLEWLASAEDEATATAEPSTDLRFAGPPSPAVLATEGDASRLVMKLDLT